MRPEAGVRIAERDIVLVHGGWHGGWAWERLVPLLAGAGHRVLAPTLTGLGERAAELTADVGWQTHVDDILGELVASDLQGAVLVGHSYGGSVITGVADRAAARLSALIYVDAVIPEHGRPGLLGFPPERQAAMLAGAAQMDGLRVPPPDPTIWGFAPGSPEHDELRQRLTPHPLKTMKDAPTLSGQWRRVARKHYLLAAGPPASRFAPVCEALRSESDWTTAQVPGSHEMMWTHPQALADALLAVIAELD